MSLLWAGSLQSLVNRAGSSRAASRPAICRPACAPQHAAIRRGSTAAAAAAASADAAPAAESAAEEEPAATAEQPPKQRRGNRGRSRDNNRGADAAAESSDNVQMVRIAAETIHTKVAAFLLRTFADHDSSYTVILQAAGASAYAQALKALARLQQMLADNPSTADRCVVFKARCVQASDGEGSRTFNSMRIVVNLAPKSDWPAIALAPVSKEDAAAADADSGKSSSSSSDSSERRVIATAVRMQDSHEEKAQETQRLSKHMLRTSQRSLPAQFLLAGRPDKLASVSAAFLYAVDDARMSTLTAASEPCDLACTIVSQSRTVERFSGGDAGKESSPGDAAAPAAADSDDGDDGAAAEQGASSSAAAEANAPFVRNLYFVTVQRCQASKNAISAARSAMRAQQRDRTEGGSRRGSSGSQTRPGYIEVREEEWNQLKEQLQVVPHLTEQLQIMTRQHEQLLSLLATQQGAAPAQQQPSDDA